MGSFVRGTAALSPPQRVGGPADDRGRAGCSGRPGRHVVANRELPRFSSGVSGDELAMRALQQARRLGAEILVTRSITRIDPARQVHLDGGDVLREDDHSRLRRLVAASVSRGIRRAHRERRLLRRRPQRGCEHARAGRPHRRGRELGGSGRDVLREPRTKRDGDGHLSSARSHRHSTRASSSRQRVRPERPVSSAHRRVARRAPGGRRRRHSVDVVLPPGFSPHRPRLARHRLPTPRPTRVSVGAQAPSA